MIKEIENFSAIILLIIFVSSILTSCDKSDNNLEVRNDEIVLQIKLDTKEDIGLFLINYIFEGQKGSGGISNADKTLLKRGELLTYTLNRKDFNNLSDIKKLEVQFIIISKYFEPNYENIYPIKYTKPLDTIFWKANYGEKYYIIISGDKVNGYKASLKYQ